MKKTIFCLLLSLCVLLSLASCKKDPEPCGTPGEGGIQVEIAEGLLLTKNSGEDFYTVSGLGSCTATAFQIPATYEGVSVARIGDGAFAGCAELRRVVLPTSITEIGESAFEDCTGLLSIELPSGLTLLGGSAFAGCTSLAAVTIPGSVREVGMWAFAGCSALAAVQLGEGIQELCVRAFADCVSLCGVQIPASVRKIEACTFYLCTGLADFAVAEGNECYQAIDGNLYSKDGKTLVQYAMGKQNESFTIPHAVVSIEKGAFSGYGASLRHITVDGRITSSLSDALFGSGVSELSMAEGTTMVREEFLSDCIGLSKIHLPASVQRIGRAAFSGCGSLTEIDLSENTVSIGDSAFSGCGALVEIDLPENTGSIGASAFSGCSALATIRFAGTTARWRELQRGTNWCEGTPATVAVCTDGTVPL